VTELSLSFNERDGGMPGGSRAGGGAAGRRTTEGTAGTAGTAGRGRGDLDTSSGHAMMPGPAAGRPGALAAVTGRDMRASGLAAWRG
jgi:hypothetical protein